MFTRMAFTYKTLKIFAIRRARYSVRRKGRGILSPLHAGRLAASEPSNIAAILHYVFPHARLGIWPTLKKAEFLQYIFFVLRFAARGSRVRACFCAAVADCLRQ